MGDRSNRTEPPHPDRSIPTTEPSRAHTARPWAEGEQLLRDAADEPPSNREHAERSYTIVARALGLDSPDDATQIDRYSILRQIGSGGMGVVYAAYDPTLDRQIALKLLPSDRDDGHARARILREARGLAQLSHPNVVQVYEHGQFEGAVYLAMEFVRGQTLRQWSDAERRSWHEILDVYLQAGDGLAAAHAAGLVHRDFKPDNAVVGDDGRVRVIDFGLVAARSPAPERRGRAWPAGVAESPGGLDLTTADGLVGTPAYMAPEQLQGDEADARTDQFNFCVSLYEALIGELPFAGRTPPAVLEAMSTPPDPSASARGRIPGFLLAAVLRGLRRSAADRFSDMPQLLAALRSDPRRRRRRWAAIAMLGATVPALWAGHSVMQSRARSRCAKPGAQLVLRWDETMRDRVRSGLTSSELAFADATATRVDTELDRYVHAWSDTWQHACVRTEVEDERPVAMFARTTECLRDRQLAFESLAELLSEPSVSATVGAARAAMDLPQIADCVDDAWLLHWHGGGELPPPAADVHAALARARTLGGVGAYGEARTIAAEALKDARAIDHPPTTVAALLELGVLERRMGDLVDSRHHLEDGFHLAVEAELDHMTALFASELVRTVGIGAKEYERAAEWGRFASAIIERTDQRGTLIDARLRNKLGLLEAARGNGAAARQHYGAALELRRTLLGPEHPSVGGALGNLGILEFEHGELDDALMYMTECLAVFEVSLGPRHPKVGSALGIFGRLYETRGDSKLAAQNYRASLAILEPVLGPDHPEVRASRRALATLAADDG